eukprot:11950499-Prorocentrum_lima.AAC.1
MAGSAAADLHNVQAGFQDAEDHAEGQGTKSMSSGPTTSGKLQVISRSASTYVHDFQPDLDPNKLAPGGSVSTPTLPLKHTTPQAPPNPQSQKGVE